MDHGVMNRNESSENFKRDFGGTLDDAEELVRMTADQTGEQVTAARKKIMQSISQARQELSRMQMQATDTARRAAYGVDDYVHTHPWKTLGFAALIGVVVGLLIARRDH
jgi:ElaB/YqjD/DUF883 family membrane-anchored ribosome-binding protein